MTHQLTARCALGSEDPLTDYFRVGLAEHPDFTGWYLMFHSGPADPAFTLPDEEYCLETRSAAFAFGGLTGVELTANVLRLRLTDQATAQLELPDSTVEITLDVDPAALRQVSDGLARVFAGTSSTSRPVHIHLPGARLDGYGRRRRRQRKPQSVRVEFEVIRQKGQLVTVRSVDGTRTTRDLADHLGGRLGIDPAHLVGVRYSCLLTPDNWGVEYSDHQLIKP